MRNAPPRIREYRKARGWTLRDLAPHMQISVGELGKVERGERPLTITHLRQAAAALACSTLELLPCDLAPPDVLELAARYSRLSPEDQAILRRVTEALARQNSN